MDNTEQFAAFALMGLLAANAHHKTLIDVAWDLGRQMEAKAKEHRDTLRRTEHQWPAPTEAPGK